MSKIEKKPNKQQLKEVAEEFASANLKKFKKKADKKGWDLTKKELKKEYIEFLFSRLPETIEWAVRFGHIQDDSTQEIVMGIFSKLASEEFCEILRDDIKKGNKIDNIKLLPILIRDIVLKANLENERALNDNPNAELYNTEYLLKLTKLILKKKIEKMKDKGIDEDIAFDVLSVIPTEDALQISQIYRIKCFYEVLYEHAKEKTIDLSLYKKIMKCIVDENYYGTFIVFSLLEKRDRFSRLSENQKILYQAISTWCFETLEDMGKTDISTIIRTYCNRRKEDESKGKDAPRRFNLNNLSETEFEKTVSVIRKLKVDETINKWL